MQTSPKTIGEARAIIRYLLPDCVKENDDLEDAIMDAVSDFERAVVASLPCYMQGLHGDESPCDERLSVRKGLLKPCPVCKARADSESADV